MARTDPRPTHDAATNDESWPQLLAALDDATTPCLNGTEWLSPDQHQQKRAANLCGSCQILTECRTFALIDREAIGVWGGTTTAQRKALRRHQRLEKHAA